MPMVVRRATPEDSRAIATIHVTGWQTAYEGIVPPQFLASLSIDQREDAWRKRLEQDASSTWVVEGDGGVLGWISTGASGDADALSSTRELLAIYVDPKHWRRGVGHRLWAEAEDHLKRTGVHEVTLWVLKNNAGALAFYHSNGFVEDGAQKTTQLGGAELLEIRLHKALREEAMLGRIQVLMQQAQRARHEGRSHDAHRHFAEAVTLCRQATASRELIHALKGLGQIERDLGNADAAQSLYEEAVTLCRLGNDALQLAHTVRHLGDIHQDAGRLDRAEPCYREALALYRASPETLPLDLANTLRPLAILEEHLGRSESAIVLWMEAGGLYEAVNVQEGVVESARHLRALGK